jgi:hypothetical protein
LAEYQLQSALTIAAALLPGTKIESAQSNVSAGYHEALDLMHKDCSNVSLRGKFNLAAWKEDFLAKLLAQA